MSKFSVSRVNTYLENPWKHWCKYIAKYKPIYDPEENKYMDRGTVFHKAIEMLAQGKDKDEAMSIALSEADEKGFADEAKECGSVAFSRYLSEHDIETITDVIETEYELNYKLSDTADFIGYIDAIRDNGDGTVTLIDYKTYGNAPQENKLRYGLQANMYMYVATQLGYKVKSFMFDCVNPKTVLKGRAYKTKRIEFIYNENVTQEMFEQFCELVKMIENYPDFKLYVAGDYMPDRYDLLYKVWVGDVVEDLDEFIEKNFTFPIDNDK